MGRKIVFRCESFFALGTAVQGMHLLQVIVDKLFRLEFCTYTLMAVTHWSRSIFIFFTLLALVFFTEDLIESLLDRSLPPVIRQEVPSVQLHFTGQVFVVRLYLIVGEKVHVWVVSELLVRLILPEVWQRTL